MKGVCCAATPAAVRITTIVRSLNRDATVITLVRDPHWRRLATYLGADQVLAGADLVGRLLGMTIRQPVLAVLRHGIRLWRDHSEASRLRANDRLLVLRASPNYEHH